MPFTLVLFIHCCVNMLWHRTRTVVNSHLHLSFKHTPSCYIIIVEKHFLSRLFRMLLKIVLGLLTCTRALAAVKITTPQRPPPLLLVSFDGFRADYLQRFPMPNLKLLYSQGVLVEQLTNIFITKTFPNHYTLVKLLISVHLNVAIWKSLKKVDNRW